MSTSLYEISNRYKGALSVIENGDLELIDMQDTLEGIEGEFNDKAIAVVMYGQNLLPTAQAKKDLAKKLIDEAKQLEAKNQKMLDYLDGEMQRTGITEIECPYFKIRYRKLPDVVEVEDLDKLPDSMVVTKTTHTADNKAIKEALKDGDVSGARLLTGRTKLEVK